MMALFALATHFLMLTSLKNSLMQLLLPQAAAFLINHRYGCHYSPPRSLAALRATSTLDDPNIQHINQLLMDKKQELLDGLLDDPCKLSEQSPLSIVAADNDLRDAYLTTEQRVYETLLSSRLDLPFLNRAIVGPSEIEGAGRGLFATEDIKEGDVITCYPGDALLCELPSTDEGGEGDPFDLEDDENEAVDEVVLWGRHVPKGDRWDDDTVFDGSKSSPPLTSYAVTMSDVYSVMGHPSLDDNPAYIGHFANDGAGHLAYEMPDSPRNIEASLELGLDTESSEFGVEDNIAAYVLKSFDVANAMHQPVDDDEFHMVTVAIRDIKKGEEILVTYGPDYWISDYAGHIADAEDDS
ncbi:hypothetical protein QTG54_016264 [Skeletonema marinoi]|uniref:SET domain-containing protein n=1 Tax=Skeletonema marinoi TaxID=267567 RepID=A0AAD8XTK4_9STRA|nr:hypothetical protein QTG54_016264 [Skeletonema marinoi]